MTRFPPYPTDILSRADALLSSKYPDGIVDPRFVEVACEAMMAEQERCAEFAREWLEGRYVERGELPISEASEELPKAIRGASPVPETAE